MFFDLRDKKVFLTGSTGTIGSSIASVFDKSGATLICTSTSESKLKKLKEVIGEKHFFYLLNLKNNKELDNKLNEIIKAHNDINVIINNAGYNDELTTGKAVVWRPDGTGTDYTNLVCGTTYYIISLRDGNS